MRARLTMEKVDQMEPGSILWDSEVVGLAARRQAKSIAYVVKFRASGKQRFVTIGRHGDPWTPKSAREEARKILGGSTRDTASVLDPDSINLSLASFAQRYIDGYARPQKKPRTWREDERNLRTHILPALGHIRLRDISRADIARFQANRSCAPVNANRCLALISHIMTVAEKWGVREFGTNPCRGIDRYRETIRERYLSTEELLRLGKSLDSADPLLSPDGSFTSNLKTGREDWRAVSCIRLLLFTGARLNEILSLRWTWIDWERCIARLPDSKTGRRTLALTDPAIQLLHRIRPLSDSTFVLPGNRAGSHFIGIQRPWQRIRRKAGLDDLRIHDLRHTFASSAVANGDSLYIVGSILGHRQSTTTQRYAHLSVEPILDVANRTAARISDILSRR
jgi:integrase